MVEGRRTFGVVVPIPKGRHLRIHCNDSESFFFQKANIGHLNKYDLNGLNKRKMGSRY